MSLRLPSFDARWTDLAQGVRVYHRPATRAEVTAASAWARQEADKATEATAALLNGAKPSDDRMAAVVMGFTSIALARLTITAWEGVEGDCTPDACAVLMQMIGMAEAFFPAALSVMMQQDAEGNGFAPAPNGTLAAGAITATHAPSQGNYAATE